MTDSFAARLDDLAQPPMVVAELSANHNGDRSRFFDLIRAAADSGAHAVKFQTYTADTMTLDIDGPDFQVSADHELWGSRRLYQLYEEAHTPWEWQEDGFSLAHDLGMKALSSPFDQAAVDFLASAGTDAYKIASLELLDHPLMEAASRTGKPVIVSTGTGALSEIASAVEVIKASGASHLTVLLCTSSYPARPQDSHLVTIPVWAQALGVTMGLSDHTLGIGVSIAATALGARFIERHFTLARSDGGPDAAFSLEPAELSQLVRESEVAWLARGTVRQGPTASEDESTRLRRSLYLAEDIRAGDLVTSRVVRAIRPGGGLSPTEMHKVIGRRFVGDAVAGTPMSWDLLAPRAISDES